MPKAEIILFALFNKIQLAKKTFKSHNLRILLYSYYSTKFERQEKGVDNYEVINSKTPLWFAKMIFCGIIYNICMGKNLWNTTWIVLRPLLAVFCRYRITGVENIKNAPKPCILAIATHSNVLDSYIASAAMPFNCHLYPIPYMTKDAFFKMLIVKNIVKAYKAFPVIRGLGLENTLKPAVELIKQGYPVGMFVEGKINKFGELREAKPGAAALALMTGAPIIPIALKGTCQIRNPLKFLFLQRKINVSFGQPIYVQKNYNENPGLDQKAVNELTEKINSEIKRLHSAL